MDDLNHFFINKIPSSAKAKSNQIPNNISFYISQARSQGKRKTCKDKNVEYNGNTNTNINTNTNTNIKTIHKKSIPIYHPNCKFLSKEKNIQIYNISNINNSKYHKNFIQNVTSNQLIKNNVGKQYNEQNFCQENFNNNIIQNNRNDHFNLKQYNTEYEDKSKSCKNKIIVEVKNKNPNILIINNIQHNLNFKNKKNSINIGKNKNIFNENCSFDGNNNKTFHAINNNNNFNNKSPNFILKGDNNNIELKNSNLTTTKINGKTKKIYNDYFFKNNNMNNINEYMSYEKLNCKLEKKKFCQTSDNFYYKKPTKPTINNGKIKILDNNKEENHNSSKSNNKVKNVFIKNKAQTQFLNNSFRLKNIDNNYIYNDKNKNEKNYNLTIMNDTYLNENLNNINNDINNKQSSIINNMNRTTQNFRIKSLGSQLKRTQIFKNDLIKNITPKICTPNFRNNNKINNFDVINNENNINIRPNIIVNDNKNIFTNNRINEKLNKTYNYSKINEKLNNLYFNTKNNFNNNELKKKNYSYDCKNNNNKQFKNNTIKNLKNNNILRKNGITANDKIKTYNIKNRLLDNTNLINEKKEEEMKESKNTIKNNDLAKSNEKEESLYEESIIYNDNEVYGTLSLKNTINTKDTKDTKDNKDNKDNKVNKDNKDNEYNNHNKNNKDNNKDNNIQDIQDNNKNNNKDIKNENQKNIFNKYRNNNYRETITIKFVDNINNENNNKIKIEDILKDKNLLQKKINENINNINQKNNTLYFKNYYSKSNAGKNYGIKKTNQDTPLTSINICGIKGFNIFGVLDGHGVNGHYVSKFVSDYLIKEIINNIEMSKIKHLDKIYEHFKKSNFELLINIFLKTDLILGKQTFDVNFSGTTCVLVIQIGRNLICANVGDSRAILIYDKNNDNSLKSADIFELSHDCKPDIPSEKERIIRLGGTVDQMLDFNGMRAGPQRVWAKNKNYPGLAMSRSLGDYQGKKCGIIPIPDIIEYKLDEKSKYCIICSDGVWEFLTNKNVMEIGNEYYLKKDIIGYTHKLIEISENLWEKKDVIVDDITVVVIFF